MRPLSRCTIAWGTGGGPPSLRGGRRGFTSGCAACRAARRAVGEPREGLVERRVDEAWVGVPVHQRVDLQLGLIEGVWRRLHHVTVDDLTHARVEGYLQLRTRVF